MKYIQIYSLNVSAWFWKAQLVVIQLWYVCNLGGYDLFFPVLYFVFYLFTGGFSSRTMSTVMGKAFLNTSAYITHIHEHTFPHPPTHTNTPHQGAVVNNRLYFTPDASVEIVIFMLKQQERTSAEMFYGPCLTADLGWASLFQILTSATTVEIPNLTLDQALRLIPPH